MKLTNGKVVYPSTPIYSGSNFTWGEATKDCTRPIEDLVIDGRLMISAAQIEDNIVKTAAAMDVYRKKLHHRPITVTSWYRPARINAAVGGSKYSRHQYGDAVDWVTHHMTPAKIARRLEANHTAGGYHAYRTFTHTDWRGHKARW